MYIYFHANFKNENNGTRGIRIFIADRLNYTIIIHFEITYNYSTIIVVY